MNTNIHTDWMWSFDIHKQNMLYNDDTNHNVDSKQIHIQLAKV